MQLELLPKREVWLLHKVNGFSAEILDDSIRDG